MGAAPTLALWLVSAAERADPSAGLRQFLVRTSRHRTARRGRRRQHYVGVRLPAHRVDLSRLVEIRRALAPRRTQRRARKNAVSKCAGALRIDVTHCSAMNLVIASPSTGK